MNRYLIMADYITQKEQKYKLDDKNQIIRINGVPGDVKVIEWFRGTFDDAYMDVVVGNVFAKTYIKDAAEKRLSTAIKWEEKKRGKYKKNNDILPLAIESAGGIGHQFRQVIHQMAGKISTRKEIELPIMINRIRSNVIAMLMKHNAKMVISSMDL